MIIAAMERKNMNRLREWMIRKLGGCLIEDVLKEPQHGPVLMCPVTMAATMTATRRIEDDGMAFDSLRLEAAKEGTRMDLVREAERLGAFVESVEKYAGKSYVKTELTVMVPQGREVRTE
nr:MAG TPA_asm: hypothetical protein [Caudoviricetes sp.]